jgi:DNA-binding winged helix-turn-helix (wHTH) protein
MEPVLIFERDSQRAIEIGRSLAPLGMPLHNLVNPFDIDHIVRKQKILAVVVGDQRDRRAVSEIVKRLPSADLPVFTYQNADTLRRRIGGLRLKAGCNGVLQHVHGTFSFGADFELDARTQVLTYGSGLTLSFAQTEFAILLLLAKNHGKLVYKNDLLHELWGRADRNAVRALDVHIFGLRHKLSSEFVPMQILSVPRVGFVMKTNLETPDAARTNAYRPVAAATIVTSSPS